MRLSNKESHYVPCLIFSFTIIFFAKEESNCTIVPDLPEAFPPIKVPFKKGTAQKFLQAPGTGTDLGFFSLDDLSKPSPEEVYPLVISAETVISPSSVSEEPLVHKQITQACLEKINDGSFKVKVMKQILWIEGDRYELHELYGIDNSTTQGNAALGLEDTGDKECVICLTEPKNTAVMPCRHLVRTSSYSLCFLLNAIFHLVGKLIIRWQSFSYEQANSVILDLLHIVVISNSIANLHQIFHKNITFWLNCP